jgi:hypothetical protein
MCACGGGGPNDGGFTINQICEIIIACRPSPTAAHKCRVSGRANTGSPRSPGVARDALAGVRARDLGKFAFEGGGERETADKLHLG